MPFIVPYDRETRKRGFVRRYLTAGPASDYVAHARYEIKAGDRVILACRVSGYVQARKKNLADQEANLRKKAKRLGAIVAGIKRHVGSGYDPDWLSDAAIEARRLDAKIFAETTDRLIRSPIYSKDRQHLQARDADLQAMRDCTEGIILVTDEDPDASPSESRSRQCKRGQRMKGKKGGRPVKRKKWKARRLSRIERAAKLRQRGLSYRQIADTLNARRDGFPDVTGMGVFYWLKRA